MRTEHFEGTIARTLAESTPWFDPPPDPGADAPDVVVILLDDTGFAQLGCFGSDIDTRHIDALAADGIRFTNFHVTPLCSPTRAALLTGRSHHVAGMRGLSNFRTGFPHMLGHVSTTTATMAEVLSDVGYATFAVGKWHLAPMEECSAAGPFDQWPLGRGFDRFYGFLDGETDQFHPTLTVDNHHVDPPYGPEDGYHLTEDLVDRALEMITASVNVRPDRPIFTWFAPGATHAPHQAPQEYLDRYRGRYDEGWDVVRARWFDRQKELGVIPPHTELSPRNPGVEAWEDLPEVERRLACRLQEAFAAFLDHTDDQIGRLLAGIEELGRADNTIVVLMSDNGASQEGGPYGVMHEMKFFNGILETPEQAIGRLDDIGGPHSHTNYPWGWAQCGNTPYRWYKQNTHEGGVHVPFILRWPNRFGAQAATMRHQFAHASDLAPTIYELLDVTAPETYRGVGQRPISGRSFASVLGRPDAPVTNTVQYFEMAGSRAIVAWPWKAVCKHVQGADYDTEAWELYDLSADPSECHDLAGDQPERLAQLVDLWWAEAEANQVLPLDDRLIELFGIRFRPRSPHPEDRRYVYRPSPWPMPAQAGAAIGGRDFDLAAHVTRDSGQEGVLYATGTENSGLSVFVQDDRLVLDYNAFDDHTVVVSDVEVPTGDSELVVQLRRSDAMAGSAVAGRASLRIDGNPCGSAELPLFMRIMSSVGASVGHDHGSAVSPRYEGPFPFTGVLHDVTIRLSPGRAAGTDSAHAAEGFARQ